MTKTQQTKRRELKRLAIIGDVNVVANGANTDIYFSLKVLAEACLFLLEKK
jgi:hypothetical protein